MQCLRPVIWILVLLAVAPGMACLSSSPAAADPFASFITGLRSACAKPPASRCAAAINGYLDTDASGRIELRELEAAREQAKLSIRNKPSPLSGMERNIIAVGLMIINHAELAKVFANFDANGDGGLTSAEMFADFRMDRRPFRAIVKDPNAVNWKAFAARFGKVGFLITGLVPKPSRR
jgi:hypothetical protein